MGIDFEWDPNKAVRNLQKHGVSFEEAATVIRDDLSISVPDPDHSIEEGRFITVGMSSQNRLLMVAHTERGDLIRIISARELMPREIGSMKKQTGMDDELRSEYDLSELLKAGVRGKYSDRYREGTNLVLLAPDVAAVFPDESAVNEALRLVMQLARIPKSDGHGVVEP